APDLVADILDDRRDRRGETFRAILVQMLQLSEQINGHHVVDRLGAFIRAQQFKSLVIRSSEPLEALDEMALPEVESMWADMMRARDVTLDPGMTPNDVGRFLRYFERRQAEFTTGIKQFDDRGIVPYRGAAHLFLAATGLGKSWW